MSNKEMIKFVEQVSQISGVEVYTYNNDNLLTKVEVKTEEPEQPEEVSDDS